jgi:hypothetical protein
MLQSLILLAISIATRKALSKLGNQMSELNDQQNLPANESEFLKGECTNCHGHFEFPKSGLGEIVACPHCKTSTVLIATTEEPIAPPVVIKSELALDAFKTSDGEIFGHFIKSPSQEYLLVWSDQWAAGHPRTKGPFYLFHGKDEICKGQIQRPNDGQVADNGSFIFCDWLFTQNLSSVFYAFNRCGEVLVEKKLRANLYNAAISQDGLFAACQTAVNNDSRQGELLTLFDLTLRKEIWHINPPFCPEFYEFRTRALELIIRGCSPVYKACVLNMVPASKG